MSRSNDSEKSTNGSISSSVSRSIPERRHASHGVVCGPISGTRSLRYLPSRQEAQVDGLSQDYL
jgi:hypothetical protein